MNRYKLIALLLFMVLPGIMFLSCKKSDPTPVQPDYPQLIGTWEGLTSQNQPIRLTVTAVTDLLVISTYKYNVIKYDTGSTYRVMEYNYPTSTIVTSIVDKYFKFRPYGGYSYYDYLKGTFDADSLKLKGRFNTSFPTLSGSSTDSVTGSFTALKVK